VDPKTVCRWLRIYQDRGLAGLPSRWAPGRTPYIPETLAPELLEWVKQGPVVWGLNRANWSYPELADCLYKSHGIAVKESAMRHFCHKQGIRPYRPTYRFLRGDPERQAKAREDLGELKKSPHW
jgi:transposase